MGFYLMFIEAHVVFYNPQNNRLVFSLIRLSYSDIKLKNQCLLQIPPDNLLIQPNWVERNITGGCGRDFTV